MNNIQNFSETEQEAVELHRKMGRGSKTKINKINQPQIEDQTIYNIYVLWKWIFSWHQAWNCQKVIWKSRKTVVLDCALLIEQDSKQNRSKKTPYVN